MSAYGAHSLQLVCVAVVGEPVPVDAVAGDCTKLPERPASGRIEDLTGVVDDDGPSFEQAQTQHVAGYIGSVVGPAESTDVGGFRVRAPGVVRRIPQTWQR